MANKVAAAALQFSKWLSRTITWYWMFYRTLIAALSAFQPSAASALVSTTAGVDTIMMINVGTYLVNSLGEKYIRSDRFVLEWIKGKGWMSLLNRAADIETDENDNG